MKNYLLPVFFTLFFLSSCKKDYVCECTYSSTEPGVNPVTTEYNFYKMTKNDAKSKCIKSYRDYTSGGLDYKETTDCHLK